MDEHDWLAQRFEEHRTHLRAVAYRMLGSFSEADDAPSGSLGAGEPRRRRRCREPGRMAHDRDGPGVPEHAALPQLAARGAHRRVRAGSDREPRRQGRSRARALLADSVGLALLVVFETLAPAERLSFVLHDMFAVPFEEIAPILGRSPAAARQLASRARRRVQGAPTTPDADLARQREVVDAFFAAARQGDFDALVALLDPDVVARSDGGVLRPGATAVVRGAEEVAKRALTYRVSVRSSDRHSSTERQEWSWPRVVGRSRSWASPCGRQDRRDRRGRRPRASQPPRPDCLRRLTRPPLLARRQV